MIKISDVYNSAVVDDANKDQNGDISFARFNRYSKRAEQKVMDWITGRLEADVPQIYQRQKSRDWISPFIVKLPVQVTDGIVTFPEDFYGYENSYLIGAFNKEDDCEEKLEPEVVGCNTPIELLSNSQFYYRCNTYIEGLQPSFEKPITKMVGKTFEYLPKDLGSITLEYLRYPVYAEIKTKDDPVFNDVVIDEATSINYEWDQGLQNLLTWFIVDLFSNNVREKAIKEFNIASKP